MSRAFLSEVSILLLTVQVINFGILGIYMVDNGKISLDCFSNIFWIILSVPVSFNLKNYKPAILSLHR